MRARKQVSHSDIECANRKDYMKLPCFVGLLFVVVGIVGCLDSAGNCTVQQGQLGVGGPCDSNKDCPTIDIECVAALCIEGMCEPVNLAIASPPPVDEAGNEIGPECRAQGAGGGGGAGDGGSIKQPDEWPGLCGVCSNDDDCYYAVPLNNSCANARCVDGVCMENKHDPRWVCGLIPGEKTESRCYEGRCCSTCIMDNELAGKPGEYDEFDGPCMHGHADTACGFAGELCRDCTAEGKVCFDGDCVAPQ